MTPNRRFPLRFKLMGLLLVVALVPAALLTALSVQALNQVSSSTRLTSVAALEREATARLDGLAQQSASRLDVSLEQARAEATALARFTGFLFSHPDRYQAGVDSVPNLLPANEDGGLGSRRPAPLPSSQTTADASSNGLPAYGLAGRLLRQTPEVWANEQRDLVGVYLPGSASDLSRVRRELAITSHLDSWLSATHGVNPFRLSATVVLEDGLTRGYPNWGPPSAAAASLPPTSEGYYRLASPDLNHLRQTIWTPPYEDRMGLGRVVTAGAPIYSESGEFLGVAGVDVLLADVTKSLKEVNTGPSGYALLVDRNGRLVAAPASALEDLALPAPSGDLDVNLLQSDNPDIRQLSSQLTGGDLAGIRDVSLGGEQKYLVFAPLRKTGWTLVLVEPKADVLQSAAQVVEEIERARLALFSKLQVILLLLLILIVAASLLAGAAVSRPLVRLRDAVQVLASGRLNQRIARESDDELGDLAEEFNQMAERLSQLNQGLERKVEERTSELARKAEQLRAVNEASQKIAALLDPDDLLRTLTELVADTFGYTHTAIFLLDEETRDLVLRAGVSRTPAGERLEMPAGMRLPLPKSGGGAVAAAARSGLPVVVHDTMQDTAVLGLRDWMLNVPAEVEIFHRRSRSLLVVPIRLADRVLGVIDVASGRPGAFNEDDVFTLSTLGDQLAVALENARLFAEERERRLEARDLAIAEERNRMAREIHDTLAQGFLGILLQLQTAEGELSPDQEEALSRLRRAADLARESLQEARRSVWNLRPQRLERASLPDALRQEAQGLGASGAAELEFSLEGAERPLPPAVEAAVLRVAQEALANVRKHAGASRVTLTLAYEPHGIRMTVADNGLGFDPQQVAAAASQRRDRSGFGLLSMRERVEDLGGSLTLASEPGRGTSVQVFIPVD